MIKLSCPSIDDQEIMAVSSVLRSLNIADGNKTRQFEEHLGKYANRKHVIAVSSGTSALRIALLASGVKPKDKIILTPFACDAVLNSILDLGCEPLFCDVDEETFNLSSKALEKIDLEKAKAIMVVHNFGFPCDIESIREITGNMIFIEDAAQAIGSSYMGKPIGSFGDVSLFSFYATKLMTTGEGGALLTDDDLIHKRMNYLKKPGHPTSYLLKTPDRKEEMFNDLIPLNYKMTDIQSAMGIVQLAKLGKFNEKRKQIASMYNEGLKNTGLKLPFAKDFGEHIYSRYTIRCKNEGERDRYVNHLIKNDIEVGILWPRPLHLSPLAKKFGYKEGDFPVAEKLSRTVFSIPIHPNLTNDEVMFVVEKIKEL